MSELPRGWAWSTVGDLGDVSLGRQRAPKYHHGDNMRPYLRVANVFEDRIDPSDVMEMHFSAEEFERHRLRIGDVLLNEGQSPELLGRPAIYRGQPPDIAFTNSLIRFRAGPAVTPEWALIVFRHHMHSKRFMRESRITTNIAHLSAGRLSSVEFPVPPLPEQERIVAAIEEQFSRLDAGVAALERARQNLKRMWAAVLQAAVEGSLVYRDQCEVSATDSGDLLGEEPSGGVKQLGPGDSSPRLSSVSIPPHWRWLKAGNVASFVDPQPSHRTPPECSGGIPYVGYGDISPGGAIDFATARKVNPDVLQEHRQRYRLRPGDFILGKIGTLGRPFVLPSPFNYALSANVLLVQPHRDVVLPEYLNIFFSSPCVENELWAQRSQSVQAAFGIKKAREFPVAVPPLGEQLRIVAEVERFQTVVRATEAAVAALDSRTQRLRSSILAAALSGKLVPQDPSDEPAAVLLERIAAERAASSPNGRRPTQKPRQERLPL